MTTLQAKLDAFKVDFETNRAPAEALKIMKSATEDLCNSGILDKTIKVGEILPNFILKNQDGDLIQLESLLANGPILISFFRGLWCPYCNLELDALAEAAEEIGEAGATLVVISPQAQKSAQKTQRDRKLSCDVLVDSGNAYAKKLGTVFELPEALKEIYLQFGLSLPEYNGDESWTLPMPLRAVIDTKGIIQYLDINPDYTQRPEVADALSVVKNL
jgi:peroxiredoxin